MHDDDKNEIKKLHDILEKQDLYISDLKEELRDRQSCIKKLIEEPKAQQLSTNIVDDFFRSKLSTFIAGSFISLGSVFGVDTYYDTIENANYIIENSQTIKKNSGFIQNIKNEMQKNKENILKNSIQNNSDEDEYNACFCVHDPNKSLMSKVENNTEKLLGYNTIICGPCDSKSDILKCERQHKNHKCFKGDLNNLSDLI